MKYHISPGSGEPKRCTAKQSCPFGEDTPHFSNSQEAQTYFEKIMNDPPIKTDKEKRFLNELKMYSTDILIAVNESDYKITVNGQALEYIDKLSDYKIAEGNSKEISEFLTDFTKGESEYEDGLIELSNISHKPIGSELKEHYANSFEVDGETYVLDVTYSEIDPNAEYPYLDTLENWRKSLDRTSFMGRDEYVPPPIDPRTLELPKFKPDEVNPLIERAVLSDPQDKRNGTVVRFLEIDQVKVASVRYKVEKDGYPHLHSIETRPEYKNQGYMKKLLKTLAEEYNIEKVYSSSKFTKHGYDYTRHLTQSTEGEEATVEHADFTDDKPFTFVDDWIEGNTQ
jgi:GNAT superfamily N-acetyltransferase